MGGTNSECQMAGGERAPAAAQADSAPLRRSAALSYADAGAGVVQW
jgi:hypothetical protein